MVMFEWTRSKALAFARPIHIRLRTQKLKTFQGLAGREFGTCSLLDVGGGLGIDREFAQLYQSFKNVTVINIRPSSVDLRLPDGSLRLVVADGCVLPFQSRTFDWVFSNAVIEHVGNQEKQLAFANEIRRVARRGYFVTTPNKYFPIEPHTFLPFYQYLSPSLQRRVVRFSPGYLREYEEIRLLSVRSLKRLFPEAEVLSVGFPILGNSIIAYYPRTSP